MCLKYMCTWFSTCVITVSPYRDETLPDLYRLMDALETGKTDLDTVDEPPSLFTRPEHVPNYKKISELKLELEEEDIQPYVENFEDEVRDDVLMIGSIKLEDVQVMISTYGAEVGDPRSWNIGKILECGR